MYSYRSHCVLLACFFLVSLFSVSTLAQSKRQRMLETFRNRNLQRAIRDQRILNNDNNNQQLEGSMPVPTHEVNKPSFRKIPITKNYLPDGRLMETVNSMKLHQPDKLPDPVDGQRTMFFVIGPESSGNRYMVDLLVRGGNCIGKSGHVQPFDVHKKTPNGQMSGDDWAVIDFSPLKNTDALCGAMHRSLPHANRYPNLVSMFHQATEAGFNPFVILTFRSEPEMMMSQLDHHHVKGLGQARLNIHDALRVAFDAIARTNVKFEMVSYENLGHAPYIRWLYKELNLGNPTSAHPEFKDQNNKYQFERFYVSPDIGSPLPQTAPEAKAHLGPSMSKPKFRQRATTAQLLQHAQNAASPNAPKAHDTDTRISLSTPTTPVPGAQAGVGVDYKGVEGNQQISGPIAPTGATHDDTVQTRRNKLMAKIKNKRNKMSF